MSIRSLAVFCGSKNGNNPLFIQHAIELGQFLASHQIRLIYGGGSVGLMGAIADSVIERGGKVTGVIPKVLLSWEKDHKNLTEMIVAEDMHDRKKLLYSLCDSALILPGGFGTLDELFEMLTWNQLSIHDKQIFLLNTAGFYDHLVGHISRLHEEAFLYDDPRKRIIVLEKPIDLKEYI